MKVRVYLVKIADRSRRWAHRFVDTAN